MHQVHEFVQSVKYSWRTEHSDSLHDVTRPFDIIMAE